MKINSPELIERKIIKGISLSEWEKQIPDEQRYKVGAYVMLLANKYDYLEMPPEMIFANGDTGLIKEKQDNGYIVELVRNKEEVLVERIIRHNTRLLNPDKQEREEIKARYNYDVQQVKIGGQTLYSIGQVEYMPMSLAWASTVHKCLWEDEYILLSDGLRKLKDVSIGSWTRDRNGVAVKITGKAKSHKRAFRVETKLGHSLICSWDHRLLTKEGFKPIEMLTKSDRKLANTKRKGNGDKLFIPEVIVQGFPVDLPTSYKTSRGTEIITPAKLDEQTAWMIGALIGDGCYTDQRDGTIEFNNSDEFLQELMTEAWTSFGLNIGRYEREGNSKVYTTSKQFRNWLHAVGLEYTTAERKSIPACILTASLAIRRMFLRGLFDTDGSVNQKQGRVSFTTASKQLCREVHLLLHSVGVISGRFEIGARNHRVEFSGISLRNFVDVGFYKKCKSQKLQVALERQMNSNKTNLDYAVKGVWDYIIEIEDLGIDLPMIDLEVEEPNEFIVGGVVSHNSQGLSLDLVQIDMRNHFFSMAGMSYVAMSRCRTVEGMKIVGNQELMARRCKIDSKVKRFI